MTDHHIPIELTQGYVAYVDPIDADLADFNWHVHIKDFNQYAMRRISTDSGRKWVHLHREVLMRILKRTLGDEERADPIDGNGLNCSRNNLRLAAPAQIQQSRINQHNNTSGYRGVYLERKSGKFIAQIGVNGTTKRIGQFDTPVAAYEAYCKSAVELYGEFARTK